MFLFGFFEILFLNFHKIFALIFRFNTFFLLLSLFLFLFGLFANLVIQSELFIIFFLFNQFVNTEKPFVQLRLCSGSEEMIKSKHGFFSYFFSNLCHIPQSYFVDVLCKISVSFNRIQFRFEFCINTWIEFHTITSACFPL